MTCFNQLGLDSILKGKFVTCAVPNNFNNTETPIICYPLDLLYSTLIKLLPTRIIILTFLTPEIVKILFIHNPLKRMLFRESVSSLILEFAILFLKD